MNNEALWFSNRCRFFDVDSACRYSQAFSNQAITTLGLQMIDCDQAARWFDRHEDEWRKFLIELPLEIEKLRRSGGDILFWNDPRYPLNLKNIFCPAAVLFYIGDVSLLNDSGIAVVGARVATSLGLEWVRRHVPDFVAEKFVIISGGARGVDAEAHEATINASGKTIAFLPGGVLNPYPSSNQYIFEKAIKSGGLLVSEFISTDIVRRENFHQRNRLIAGLADVVLIVEAKLKSGTIMTAHKARDENKDVFIVPGHPLIENYAGSLSLIVDGAQIAISAAEPLAQLKRNVLKKIALSPNLVI